MNQNPINNNHNMKERFLYRELCYQRQYHMSRKGAMRHLKWIKGWLYTMTTLKKLITILNDKCAHPNLPLPLILDQPKFHVAYVRTDTALSQLSTYHSSSSTTMATRSKLYFTLALCFNCFIITFLILDSRSFSTLDINLGLLPETWNGNELWLKSKGKGGEQLYLHELSLEPEKKKCGMCTGNSTLCEEVGSVLQYQM